MRLPRSPFAVTFAVLLACSAAPPPGPTTKVSAPPPAREKVVGGRGFSLPASAGYAPRARQGSRVVFMGEHDTVAFVQAGSAFPSDAELVRFAHVGSAACSTPEPHALGGQKGMTSTCVTADPAGDATRVLRLWTGFRTELQWLVGCVSQPEFAPDCERFLGALTLDPALGPEGLDGIQEEPVAYDDPGEEPRFVVDVQGAPGRGAPEPLVTVVMFADFECPFSARAAKTMEALVENYPNDVRVVYRHQPLPFHVHAKLAAEASVEAQRQGGDRGFFAFHDAAFARHAEGLTADVLTGIAGDQGLDTAAFAGALQDHRHAARVEQDISAAARLEARGTPTLFLNGLVIRGAQPLAKFEEFVEAERARARQVVMLGVPRRDVYALAMRGARTEGIPAEKTEKEPEPDLVYKVPVQGAPVHGAADALVTLVEFTDFECPFCQRASATVKELEQRYGKDLRVVVLNNPLPFHKAAALAAEASLEAFAQKGHVGYFRYYDALFENAPARLTREDLERIAAEQGLNMVAFRRALDGHVHKKRVDQDAALARKLGATGTPSFFINGRVLKGAQPTASFVALIDRELAFAAQLVERGTRRAKVYAAVQKDAVDGPPRKDEPLESYPVADAQDAASLGPNDAPVTLVEFTDFQCPFCARVRPTLEALRAKYGKRIRLVLRNYPLPFHADAFLAAEAAHEVLVQLGNDGFWKYHDVLFDHQDALSAEHLIRYASELGKVDLDRFRRALEQRTHRARVQADIDAVENSGARIGTPSFFINGYLVQGAQDEAKFVEVIDRALQEAKKR